MATKQTATFLFFTEDGLEIARAFGSDLEAFDAFRTARADCIATNGMQLSSGTWISPTLLADVDDNVKDSDIAGYLASLSRASVNSSASGAANYEAPEPNPLYSSPVPAASVVAVATVDVIDRGMGVTEQIKTSLAACDAATGCWDRIYANRGSVLFEFLLFLMCSLAFWPLLKSLFRSTRAAWRMDRRNG